MHDNTRTEVRQSFGPQDPPPHEHQIPAQLSQLDKSLCAFEELFGILDARLSSVCHNPDLNKSEVENASTFPALCYTAGRIFNSRMQVESIILRLRNLLASLEV